MRSDSTKKAMPRLREIDTTREQIEKWSREYAGWYRRQIREMERKYIWLRYPDGTVQQFPKDFFPKGGIPQNVPM